MINKQVVEVIADSLSPRGERLTTLCCIYPRYIHAEVMTHRVFSRNTSSSRAIPVSRLIKKAETEPVIPIMVKNQAGMQADHFVDTNSTIDSLSEWNKARLNAIKSAQRLSDLGIHKQIVNRLLEPFTTITTLISSTEWSNFFDLRITEHAQQETCLLAARMRDAMTASIPVQLDYGEYHLPFIREDDPILSMEDLKKVSVARCARVSYLNHNSKKPDTLKDKELHDMLKESKHASPFEHVATPSRDDRFYGNFRGWLQYRKEINL